MQYKFKYFRTNTSRHMYMTNNSMRCLKDKVMQHNTTERQSKTTQLVKGIFERNIDCFGVGFKLMTLVF